MSVLEDGIERAECAIFADTGWERKETYNHLERFKEWCSERDFPIHVVSDGDLRQDNLEEKWPSMPLFMDGEESSAPMRRQCTGRYKVDPIHRKMRELLGYRKRQRIPIDLARMWVGISRDETMRVKPSQERWIEKEFPLIDLGMTRLDCAIKLKELGIDIPVKSACIGCPYRDNNSWSDMKKNSPEEWEDAVEFDKKIRGIMKGRNVARPAFLHRELIPLDEIDLMEDQINLFNMECEGVCGL